MLLFILAADVKDCYAFYNDDGCSICVSRSGNSSNCGWCANIQSCVEGSDFGPYNNECSIVDWIYNKTQCDDAFCSTFTTKRDCKHPCSWSNKRETCLFIKNVSLADYASDMVTALLVCLIIMVGLIICLGICYLCGRNDDTHDYEIWDDVEKRCNDNEMTIKCQPIESV